jgi:hypothetical protein
MGTSGTVTHGDGAPEPEADGSPVVAPPEHRGIGIRIFSSASDAPRARRPTDVVLLIVAVLTVLVLSIPAPGPDARHRHHEPDREPGLFGCSGSRLPPDRLGDHPRDHGARRTRRKRCSTSSPPAWRSASPAAGKLSGTDWSDSLSSLVASKAPDLAVRLAMGHRRCGVAHMTHASFFGERIVRVRHRAGVTSDHVLTGSSSDQRPSCTCWSVARGSPDVGSGGAP